MKNSYKPLNNYEDSELLMQTILKSLSSDMVILNKLDFQSKGQDNLENLMLDLIKKQNTLINYLLERDR